MKFKKMPIHLIQLGTDFPFDIYIQLSSTKAVLLFKREISLTVEDLVKLKTYPEDKVILTQEDYNKFFESNVLKNIKENIITDGELDQQKGEVIVKYAFSKDADSSDKEYVDGMIKKSTEVIKGILENPTSKNDKNSLYNIIVSMEDKDEPFLAHSHKVFAISSMLLLTLPNIQMEYIDDLGFVSLLHGYGLHYLSNSKNAQLFSKYFKRTNIKIEIDRDLDAINDMVDKHFLGHRFTSFDDVGSYLKHFYIIEKVLENARFKSSRGLKRTILDFKQLETPKSLQINEEVKNPYLPSKVFLIADHLISELNILMKEQTESDNIMILALNSLKEKENMTEIPRCYDMQIIEHLIKVIE